MSAGGEIVSMGADRARRIAKRKPKLTEEHRFTIRLALRRQYRSAMENLDMHGERASFWLRQAGEAWHAYQAFTGTPVHDDQVQP